MAIPGVLSDTDRELLDRAVALALEAERGGGLPIGALVACGSRVLGEGRNRVPGPPREPGRHAEMEALAAVPAHLWARCAELTCVTTLEPCVMCFGALMLHRVGRVLFGARDPDGGALGLRPRLPPRAAAQAAGIEWVGPVDPERCDPLARRALGRSTPRPAGLGVRRPGTS